ncbi:MAG: tRNA (adenosine(37)-N6)-dimethylallyltransferase MiaA [Pseudomonadota bacterium]
MTFDKASAALPPVVFLMGPTAAGKSDLALRLCDALPAEIVSVDSAQVYRRLNIGSAKPNPHVLAAYPHHLVDIREPHESYSAADFREDALQTIAEIHNRGNVPLLVGGTGLYFRTLERGIADLPDVPDAVRQALREECAAEGSAAMHVSLQAVDAASAARIHPNDPQRVLRALEIFRVTGKPFSEYLLNGEHNAIPYPLVKIVFAPAEKATLHPAIASRFQTMLAEGLVNEVLQLYRDPRVQFDVPALRAVGYRAVWQFIDGHSTRRQMVHDGVVATRRLAKRQYTWFRGEADCKWIDSAASNAFVTVLNTVKKAVFSN